jgi:glyoxylase I family protein
MVAMSTTPTLRGIHHLGLTVNDVEVSAVWYESVLGFQRTGEVEAPGGERRKVFLTHDGLRQRLGLCEHRGMEVAGFDERLPGLDHLSFDVGRRADLEAWASHLRRQGVAHSPIAPANTIPGGAVLVFRDPDNIQLELVAVG